MFKPALIAIVAVCALGVKIQEKFSNSFVDFIMSNDKNQDGFIDTEGPEGEAMMESFMAEMMKLAGDDGMLTKDKIGKAVNLSEEEMKVFEAASSETVKADSVPT